MHKVGWLNEFTNGLDLSFRLLLVVWDSPLEVIRHNFDTPWRGWHSPIRKVEHLMVAQVNEDRMLSNP